MYRTFITLAILGFTVETQSQRHIIGSRLLDFDNPMQFVSPRVARQSKELKPDVVNSKPSNVDSEQLLNSDNNVLAFASPQIEIETPDAKSDDVKSKTSEISTAFESYQRLNHIAFDDYNTDDRVHLDDKNQFEECVPLDKCESLDWLVQNINTAPNLTPSQITDTIKDRICGFYGRIPKVLCPFDDNNEIDGTEDYAEEYTEDDDDNDDIKGTTSVPSNVDDTGDALSFEPIKNGGFTFGESGEPSKNETRSENCRSLGCRAIFNDIGTPARQRCRGSLLIHHSASNAGPLSDFKQLRLRGKNFRQMRKLRRRNIVQMQTHGNCCWTLYSKPKFRGAEEKFFNGYNIVPKVHPKSIKASHCN